MAATNEKAGGSTAPSGGPAGKGDRVVAQGDTIESIALETGFFSDTLWDHPANAELKAARGNRNVLLPGDRVTIPPKEMKIEPAATTKRHRFRRKGVPSVFRLEVFRFGKPRAGVEYTLTVDGTVFTGHADDAGLIVHWVPPDARTGTLVVGPEEQTYELDFGHMDPISEMTGVQKRLLNLGYDCGPADGTPSEKTRQALFEFQRAHGLSATGEADDETRSALEGTDDL